jgi:hypothetical protein
MSVEIADPMLQLHSEYEPRCVQIMSQDEIDHDRGGWLAARRGNDETGWVLTASEMSAVIGIAPGEHSSAFDLYHAKLTGEDSFTGNDRTELGLYLENRTAAKFAAMHPELLLGPGGLYASKRWPWLRATFDRIAHDVRFVQWPDGETGESYEPAGPVQLKSWAGSRGEFGDEHSAQMPPYYRVQLLVEMAVLGTDTAWLPVQFLPSGKVVTMLIERDGAVEQQIEALIEAGDEFRQMLVDRREPAVDWSPATAARLQQLYPLERRTVRVPVSLARRWKAAKRAEDRAKRLVSQCKNELRNRAQGADTIVAHDPTTGTERVVVKRTGGPKAGYTVAPQPFVETMRQGDWGTPPKETKR